MAVSTQTNEQTNCQVSPCRRPIEVRDTSTLREIRERTIVDPQQTRRSLKRRLETPNLGDGRLEDAHLDVIDDLSLHEVETVVHQLLLGVSERGGLRGVVVRSQLGDQVGRVLGGVDGERLGDHEKGGGELGDRKLFTRALFLATGRGGNETSSQYTVRRQTGVRNEDTRKGKW